MSTKFSFCAILMEKAVRMKRSKIKADVQESTREADRLANGDCSGFTEANRVPVYLTSMSWYVLEDALRVGRRAEFDYQVAKAEGAPSNRSGREKRRRPEETLKVSVPG